MTSTEASFDKTTAQQAQRAPRGGNDMLFKPNATSNQSPKQLYYTESNVPKTEDFWLNNYRVLYENHNYVLFYPRSGTTKTEQLNSIARFAIYLLVLLLLFGDFDNTTWLYLPFFILFLTILLHKMENIQLLPTNINNGNFVEIDPHEVSQGFDETKSISNRRPYTSKPCRRPTEDNPLMNVQISDFYDDPTVGPACDNDNIEISQQVRNEFNKNLYRDVNDMYEKQNSQRTYYSAPSTTIPNDQKAFAEWCYGVPETCKTNQEKCLRYEDLRANKSIPQYEYII